MTRRAFAFLGLLACAAGPGSCGDGPAAPGDISLACVPSASTATSVNALFGAPFDIDAATSNYFDHDSPAVFQDKNDYTLTTCNTRISGINGHNGYDWKMPVGTPIRAVADGTVMFAGTEPPLNCPPLGRTVAGLAIQIRHTAPDGQTFASLLGHLDRVDVSAGASVSAGAVIGLSGNTGCSTEPHLHFSALRAAPDGRLVFIDPYGWHSADSDPWSVHPEGLVSPWLWRPGAAPPLHR